MLLILFICEYMMGQSLFGLVDVSVFWLYFLLVGTLDAVICRYLIEKCNDARSLLYASFSFASICLHMMGAGMFIFELDDSAYLIGLSVVLYLKFIVLDKAIYDAGRYLHNLAVRLCYSVAFSFSYMAYSSTKEKNK